MSENPIEPRNADSDEAVARYSGGGAPAPGTPEFEAMDRLAKMFERQVDDLRGESAPSP